MHANVTPINAAAGAANANRVGAARTAPDPTGNPVQFVLFVIECMKMRHGWTTAATGRAVGYNDGQQLSNIVAGRGNLPEVRAVRMLELLAVSDETPAAKKLPMPKQTIPIDAPLEAALCRPHAGPKPQAPAPTPARQPVSVHDALAECRKDLARIKRRLNDADASAAPIVRPGLAAAVQAVDALDALLAL